MADGREAMQEEQKRDPSRLTNDARQEGPLLWGPLGMKRPPAAGVQALRAQTNGLLLSFEACGKGGPRSRTEGGLLQVSWFLVLMMCNFAMVNIC